MTSKSSWLLLPCAWLVVAACEKGPKPNQGGAHQGTGAPQATKRVGGAKKPLPTVGGGRSGQGGGSNAGDPTGAPPGTPDDPIADPPSGASLASELARIYVAWTAEEKAVLGDFSGRLEAAIGKAPAVFQRPTRTLYTKRGNHFLFADGGQLTEGGTQLAQALGAVPSHGLDPKPYDLDQLSQVVKAFADASATAQAAAAVPDAEQKLWRFIVDHRGKSESQLAAALDDADLGGADLASLSEARKRVNAVLASQRALNAALVELDAGLAWRLYRFVYDMRFARRAHPFVADTSDEAGLARIGAQVETFVQAVDLAAPGAVDKLLASVIPAFPDYEPTRQALARYRHYAELYPTIDELPKEVEKLAPPKNAKTKPGKDGELIKRLQARLVQEEYLTGEPTGIYGPELEAAVTAYQETHQIKATGKMDKVMRTSLNRSFAERAQLLQLSLQRYRESDLHQGQFRLGEVPMRVRVNIPSMEARFYQGTELVRRHRVIVGNNDTETEAQTGKRGKLNQTRLLTAEMQVVVLNPTWNVPKRIKEQELDTMLVDEPDYYEAHNFEVKQMPDGTEQVVQRPGPGNALGEVKFLFPNPFSIYMHDTPKKSLFERPVRAFSHGCMRTENPLDLARFLLIEYAQKLTAEEFDEVLKKREEKHFALPQRIPISTDYVTTGVDANGRIVFYSDVYGFDAAYFDGKTPYRADKDFPSTIIF